MLDVLMIPREKQTSQALNVLTIILLVIITLLAMLIQDLGMVTAVGGGTLGTVVVFIVPTLMFKSAVKRLGDRATASQKREVHLATFLMWLGIAIGVVGVFLALHK
jgi:membrane protease YdiL (CAAX protease family)